MALSIADYPFLAAFSGAQKTDPETGTNLGIDPTFDINSIFNFNPNAAGNTLNPFLTAANRTQFENYGAGLGLSAEDVDKLALQNAEKDFSSTGEFYTLGSSPSNVHGSKFALRNASAFTRKSSLMACPSSAAAPHAAPRHAA